MATAWDHKFAAFPKDDIDAAKAWFAGTNNHNFEKWRESNKAIHTHTKTVWGGFEEIRYQVTGIPTRRFHALMKGVVSDILLVDAPLSNITLEQIEAIGTKFAASVRQTTVVAWKEEATTWIISACTILAPRAVYLWMKVNYNSKHGRKREQQ
jgi:hypothetical protein